MTAPQTDMTDLMTTDEVVTRAGVSITTVLRWAVDGRLPYTRTPIGRFRFPRQAVEELIPDAALLMSTSQVAAVFRVGCHAVRRWAEAGRLTSVRTLGGNHMFWRAEVDALLRGEDPKAGGEA